MGASLFPRTPLLAGSDVESKRRELLSYFQTTFDRHQQLYDTLTGEEAFHKKPISLRHPLIFYFGHTATFFVNKFLLAGLIEERIDPGFESMFAVGVDEMSWDDLDDSRYEWPSVAEVVEYRRKLRALVSRIIMETPFHLPIGWKDPFWAVLMGIEHERIHIETSSVLIRQHALHYVQPHPDWRPCTQHGEPPANALVDIPAGKVRLGRRFDDPVRIGSSNHLCCAVLLQPNGPYGELVPAAARPFLANAAAGNRLPAAVAPLAPAESALPPTLT